MGHEALSLKAKTLFNVEGQRLMMKFLFLKGDSANGSYPRLVKVLGQETFTGRMFFNGAIK